MDGDVVHFRFFNLMIHVGCCSVGILTSWERLHNATQSRLRSYSSPRPEGQEVPDAVDVGPSARALLPEGSARGTSQLSPREAVGSGQHRHLRGAWMASQSRSCTHHAEA